MIKKNIPQKIFNSDLSIGRYCELNGLNEIRELKSGMDFRNPKYRREVFLRFYEFHLKYRSHPGGVYFIFPWVFKNLGLTEEQKLWFCYINGCTQNPCTTWAIFYNFPNFQDIDENELEKWHSKYWKRLDYDIDRRYQKGHFINMYHNYKSIVGENQTDFFNSICNTKDVYYNFDKLWEVVINKFLMYGRLSTFSYLEYLKIAGVNIDCSNLFMYDMEGSKSHRNGIAKVLGRDDLDWHKDNENFSGYNYEVIDWLTEEAEILLNEAKERFKNKSFINDVNYFTLESTFCCYKSWHRENRRYPNVYMDMMFNRIKKAESMGWGDNGIEFDIFWELRKECLPKQLLLEFNPDDPGLKPEKQNHYRKTGEVIMMDIEWDCFKNNFNK